MNWIKSSFAALALAFAAQGVAQTRELPDFTRLVEEHGAAVVNISTTQAVRRTAVVPQFPGMESEEGQETQTSHGTVTVFWSDHTTPPAVMFVALT